MGTSFGIVVYLLIYYANLAVGHYLEHFSEEEVWKFVNKSGRGGLSEECEGFLRKTRSHLKGTLQNKFFIDSYVKGNPNFFDNRDQDRWVFNFNKCLQSANETAATPSTFPFSYCYNSNQEVSDKTYGICVPTVCKNSQDIEKIFSKINEIGRNLNSTIQPTCIASRKPEEWFLSRSVIYFTCFDIFLFCVVILSTLYEYNVSKLYQKNHTKLQQLFMAFSVRKNFNKLTAYPKNPKTAITCLFGLRTLATFWVLAGHSFIIAQYYIERVDEYKNDLTGNFWFQWITNGFLTCDTFFTLSGTLVAYTWFMRHLGKENAPSWTSLSFWLKFYRHRVLRLYPVYLYIIAAMTFRYSKSYHQPAWPPTDPSIACPNYWWENVLFINSFGTNSCLPWTWYIGTEMIFYLVTPVFLISLNKSKKIGLMVCIGTIVVSGIWTLITMVQHNFPPTLMLWKQPEIFNQNFMQHNNILYIKPQYRIGPYLIGILIGYYLASLQKKDILELRSMRFILKAWMFGLLCGIYGLYGLYPALQDWNIPLYHEFYGITHRLAFSSFIAWVIYACHTGIGGPLNELLSLKIFLPLSTLSYSVYLFHMVVVVFTYMMAPFPLLQTSIKWEITGHILIEWFATQFFALHCVLFVEMPAVNIEGILLHERREVKNTSLNVAEKNNNVDKLLPPLIINKQ